MKYLEAQRSLLTFSGSWKKFSKREYMWIESRMATGKRSNAPITVFTNGNKYDAKRFIFNPRYVRTFDAFLDQLTVQTNATCAIRRIYTPHGSREVGTLAGIEPGRSYVAVSRGRFKKIPYGRNNIVVPSEGTSTTKSRRQKLAASSRLQKSYEEQMRTQKTIYVHRNGYNELPTQIFFTRKLLRSMNQVLDLVQEKIVCERAIVSLHKVNGLTIDQVSNLQPEGRYVAVEQGQRFKRIAYDQIDDNTSSPRKLKLPTITNSGFNTWRSNSDEKRHYRLPSNESSQGQTSRTKPKLKLPVIKQSINEPHGFQVIYGYPRNGADELPTHRSRQAGEKPAITPRNEHRGVFYATGAERQRAAEIYDDKRVRVDKPLDMMQAREVEEELDGVDHHANRKYRGRDPPVQRSQVNHAEKQKRKPVTLPHLAHVPKPPPKSTIPTKPSIAHPKKHVHDKQRRVEKPKDSVPKSMINDQRYASKDNTMANTKQYIVTREQRLFDMHGRDGRAPANNVIHVYAKDTRSKHLDRQSQEIEKRKRIEEWVDHTVEEKQKEDEIDAVAKQLVLNVLRNVGGSPETDESEENHAQPTKKNNVPKFCVDGKTNGIKYHRVFGT